MYVSCDSNPLISGALPLIGVLRVKLKSSRSRRPIPPFVSKLHVFGKQSVSWATVQVWPLTRSTIPRDRQKSASMIGEIICADSENSKAVALKQSYIFRGI